MTRPRALLLWALLFVVAFTNGAFRVFVIQPRVGELAGRQLACGTGILLFAAAIWVITRRWPFRSAGQAWQTGAVWVLMTIAWEFLFGHYVMGQPWGPLAADYEIWNGRLWPLVLAWLAVAPRLSMIAQPRPLT